MLTQTICLATQKLGMRALGMCIALAMCYQVPQLPEACPEPPLSLHPWNEIVDDACHRHLSAHHCRRVRLKASSCVRAQLGPCTNAAVLQALQDCCSCSSSKLLEVESKVPIRLQFTLTSALLYRL